MEKACEVVLKGLPVSSSWEASVGELRTEIERLGPEKAGQERFVRSHAKKMDRQREREKKKEENVCVHKEGSEAPICS